MSDEPRRPQNDSLPPFFWGLMGLLLVALFAIVLALMHPVA